jgi:hypothetical protein
MKKIMKHREQTKPNALDGDQYEVQRGEVDDGYHDVLQPNVKFVSLKEQSLFMVTFRMMTQYITVM